MNKIYIAGDIHGGLGKDMDKLRPENLFKNHIELDQDDVLCQLGDFGFPFYDKIRMTPEIAMEYDSWMDFWRNFPCKVLFVDGNHDNHNFWSDVPVIERFGGRVQEHPDAPEKVFHLMRGEIYEINGLSIFACGSAVSTDQHHRIQNISWWKEEQMTEEEIEYAKSNIKIHNGKVDVVVTHTPSASIVEKICYENGNYKIAKDRGANFFDELMHGGLSYKLWCAGHLHVDRMLIKERCLLAYDKVSEANDMIKLFNLANSHIS